MPKVLFCGLKNEYGKVERGVSYEFTNFYETLQRMNGVDVDSFFFDIELEKAGSRELTNVRLEEKVEGSKPDLVFCFLFTNQLLPETIRRISQKTKTFNWFADDHWRYPLYSKYWAEFFTAISTTDSLAFRLYKKQGIKNVIKTQWAANHFLFKPQTQSAYQKTWEISFLGQNFGVRGQYLDFLKKNNIPVTGVGRGWEENYNSVQEMLNVFSFSKISLNFTETSYVGVFSFLKSFIKFLLTVDPTGKWVGWKLDNNFQDKNLSK